MPLFNPAVNNFETLYVGNVGAHLIFIRGVIGTSFLWIFGIPFITGDFEFRIFIFGLHSSMMILVPFLGVG